jgi:phage baseplate assembly protein W
VHPYSRWVTREVGEDADLVAACEEAATSPSEGHSAVAARAARDSLEHAGVEPGGTSARVLHRNGCLLVMLTLPPHPEALESMVVARVVSAVREYDDRARGVDVTIV